MRKSVKPELLIMTSNLEAKGFLKSALVKRAMEKVDRSFFAPAQNSEYAYDDCPLPIGFGQTISAPSVVALMLETLDIKTGMKVLEIGTGSGYNCALLSVLVGARGKVVSIDMVPELIKASKVNMAQAGIDMKNVQLISGDGSCGCEDEAPFDRIIVTAAMPFFGSDHPLGKQLKENGKLIAPVGEMHYQDLIIYDNKSGLSRAILPVMFVPLIGKCGFTTD